MISKEDVRKVLKNEFPNDERIWAMQSFYGRESVIEIIEFFVMGFAKWKRERNKAFLMDEAGQWPSPNETDEQLFQSYLNTLIQ